MSANSSSDDLRYGAALIVAVIGLLIPAVLVYALSPKDGWTAKDIAAIVGLFTSVVGTLVGAFLGVQVGSAGKQKAEQLANRALAALPPEKAKEVMDA